MQQLCAAQAHPFPLRRCGSGYAQHIVSGALQELFKCCSQQLVSACSCGADMPRLTIQTRKTQLLFKGTAQARQMLQLHHER